MEGILKQLQEEEMDPIKASLFGQFADGKFSKGIIITDGHFCKKRGKIFSKIKISEDPIEAKAELKFYISHYVLKSSKSSTSDSKRNKTWNDIKKNNLLMQALIMEFCLDEASKHDLTQEQMDMLSGLIHIHCFLGTMNEHNIEFECHIRDIKGLRFDNGEYIFDYKETSTADDLLEIL